MSALSPDDILDIATYETIRPAYRQRVMTHKAERRVEVGELVSLTFEDLETVRYQIQEMARVERLVDPARIAHEIEVYGELLPNEHELAATLFIQIPEMDRIREMLDRLVGIDECVVLEIGGAGDAMRVRARFDERQMEEDRISAVHYLRFELEPQQRARLLDGAPARITIDHAAYRATAELDARTRASLCRDLTGESLRLIDPERVPRAPSTSEGERVVELRGDVRIVAPARPARRHHLVVEPASGDGSLTDCEPALLGALFAAARDIAAELAEGGVSSQIVVNVAPGASERARVQVISVDH